MNIESILFPQVQSYSTCHSYMGVPCLTFGRECSNVVLIFHGNGEDAKNYEEMSPYFTSIGYHVVVIEYPGYGGNVEKGNTSTIIKTYVRQLANELKKKYIHLYIIGISIGTGPATLLAKYLSTYSGLQHLYLIAPYYSVLQLATDRVGCFSWLISDPFPTYKYIPDVRCKIQIYHGSHDQIIGIEHARKLKCLNKQCTLSIYDHDHNSIILDAVSNIIINLSSGKLPRTPNLQ